MAVARPARPGVPHPLSRGPRAKGRPARGADVMGSNSGGVRATRIGQRAGAVRTWVTAPPPRPLRLDTPLVRRAPGSPRLHKAARQGRGAQFGKGLLRRRGALYSEIAGAASAGSADSRRSPLDPQPARSRSRWSCSWSHAEGGEGGRAALRTLRATLRTAGPSRPSRPDGAGTRWHSTAGQGDTPPTREARRGGSLGQPSAVAAVA